jgi:ribosomal protein S18 acetylase RimI-like enzyme
VLTIRKAKRSDVPALLLLWRELFDHHTSFGHTDRKLSPLLQRGRETARRFAAWAGKNIGSKKGVVYLAEVDGRPAGYVLAFIKPNPFNLRIKKLGYIDQLVVKKELRGQGISSALNRMAIEWFRSKRIRHLSLHVLEPNRVAQSIYRKWGFFPFVVEMRKNL